MWIGDLWNWFTVNSWWYSNLLQDCSCLPWYTGYFWIHLALLPLFLWIHVPGYQPQLDAWNGISRTAAGSSYEYVQTISGWLLYIIFDITVSWLSLISLIITIWYYLHIGIVFFCGQFSDHHGFEPTLHWHISNPQNLWIYMTLAYLLGVNILTLAIRVPSGCQASPTRFSPVIWSRSSNLFVGTCCNMTNLTFNNFQQFKSFDDKLT